MSEMFKVTLDGGPAKEIPDILLDDTIDTLKRKIIRAYNKSIGYDAIYLYTLEEKAILPELLYKELSQNGKMPITFERLYNFLLNIHDDLAQELKFQSEYTIGDLYNLKLDKKRLVYTAIGLQFRGHKSIRYPFLVNPLLMENKTNEDVFLQENATSMTSTQNSSLVMDIDNIHNSTIHVLTVEHVLNHMKSNDLDTNIAIYFPFLEKEGIDTLTKVIADKEKILEKNDILLSKRVTETYEAVGLFHDIYKKTQYPVIQSGITEYDIMIHQSIDIILPLEQVFKLLNSTKGIPFIKFNPGFRRENLLRLYSEEQTVDGTKIPYLSKALIIKLIKILGKSNSVTLYLDQSIVCSVYENGTIRINGESETPLSVEDIGEKIRLLVNPILDDIKKYVRESGFEYDIFKTFSERNVEVISMTYTSSMSVNRKKISIKPYMNCVSSIFNVSQDTISKKGSIEMRYKRVANYNEMSAIDAFIREVINIGTQREFIIEKIKDNFGLTHEEAEDKFIAFINEVDVEQTIFQNRKLRIKDNPGFTVTIDTEKFTPNIIITVKNINNIKYVKLIELYTNSLVTIIEGDQEIEIKKICKKTVVVEDIIAPEIVAAGEKPFSENRTPEITAGNELIFDDVEGDDDMLDMLMGSDDEDEDEDEDEDFMLGGSMKGGAGPSTSDITGMSLSNPNFFSKRMEDRDPSLFLKKKEGKFNAYSRMCPSNIRRQPVILTKEEKENIDKNHPDSYTNSIKYGSDPENPYYYICPRYWCIPENTSLSDEEVKAGVCGGEDAIIPFSAKKVPEGKTIYEFGVDKSNTSAHAYKEFYDDDGKYITHYPGFISGSKHPDGKCMPCCFKSWEATEQIRRRQQCSQETSVKKIKLPKKRTQADSQRDYIKGEEKFPLEKERWGYLPIELQLFFGEDSNKYQVSALDTSLKDDAITILRQGVEPHKTQSFIACIADIYSDYSNPEIKMRIDKKLKKLRKELRQLKQTKKETDPAIVKLTRSIYKIKNKPSILDMKNHIINMVTLDNYSNYQNGNLVTEFHDTNGERDISIDKYQDTELYKQLDTTDIDAVVYLEYIINSYENFIDYLKDDTVIIDYQYLWDIICTPNDKLFPNGINLVIFEIPNDDITGNVEIICPTNHYSKSNFTDKKLTLMLVKKDNFFEPIYLYNNIDKKVNRFLFREQNLKGNPNIKVALTKVREYMNSRCKPLNSLPNVYFFETNKPLSVLIEQLKKHTESVVSVVVHYNSKAIGFNLKLKTGEEGFIPCYPSNFNGSSDIPLIFMDDESYMKSYDETKDFLQKIHKLTKLPVNPVCKVTEHGMTVGLLTKTNQVVPIKTPEITVSDDLDNCQTSYSVEADKEMVISHKKDTNRIEFIHALNEETKNYTAFRNQARIELNIYKNQKIKQTILDLIESEDRDSLESYNLTLEQIIIEFKKILDKMIRFEDEVDHNNLIFSKLNLLTGENNEIMYYNRIADEALRYQQIKLFLFEKNKYLSFNETVYRLTENEILILESMITQDYFDGHKAFRRNMYVHNNNYDTSLPLLTKKYSDKLTIPKCNVTTKSVTGGIVKNLFSDSYFIKEYGDFKTTLRSVNCGFDMLKTILSTEGIQMDNIAIKELLVKSYSEIDVEDHPKILAIMATEGKEQWVQNILGNKITLETFIMSDNYYLTMIDLWIISDRLKIPVIFIGNAVKKINKKLAFAIEPKKTAYYFIRLFSPKQNTIPRYQLVETAETILKIPYSATSLPNVYIEIERLIKLKRGKDVTIDHYITTFIA